VELREIVDLWEVGSWEDEKGEKNLCVLCVLCGENIFHPCSSALIRGKRIFEAKTGAALFY
jgi:hypothetical protein